MPEIATVRDEDVIFYIDVTSKKFNKKDLIKAINDFVRQKQPLNPTGTYGLFVFEEGKTPSFTADLSTPDDLSNAIDKEWKARETEESFFENGLFFCLSHIANSFIRSDGKNLRIIVISDTPSNPGDTEKAQALIGLVEKFRYFPTFIDIIRVGDQKFYPDDVKLRIVTTTANGGLFYVEDERGLRDTLVQGLVKRKSLEVLTPMGGDRYIEPEHHAFFANMASVLVTPPPGELKKCGLCKEDICPFCHDAQDAPFMCPSCGITFHDCCAARYSIKNHIGIKHIFRCPNCGTLLKVTPAAVKKIEQESEVPTLPSEGYDTDLLQKIVGSDGGSSEAQVPTPPEATPGEMPQTTSEEIPASENAMPSASVPEQSNPSVPPTNGPVGPRFAPVGGSGFFRPRKPIKPSNGGQMQKPPDPKETWSPPKEEIPKAPDAAKPVSQQNRPPSQDQSRKTGPRVLLCRICGHNLPQRAARCPNCGSIVSQN